MNGDPKIVPNTLLKQIPQWHQAIATQIATQHPQIDLHERDQAARHLILCIVSGWLCQQIGLLSTPIGDRPPARQRNDGAKYRSNYNTKSLRERLHALNAQWGCLIPELWLSSHPSSDINIDIDDGERLDFRVSATVLGRVCPNHGDVSETLTLNYTKFGTLSHDGMCLGSVNDSASHLFIGLLGQAYEQLVDSRIERLTHPSRGTKHQSVTRPAGRKSGGVYYTPEAIATGMVRDALNGWFEHQVPGSPGFPRILDPACGGGIFLTTAYQYLLDWHLQRYLSCLELSPCSIAVNPAPIQPDANGHWRLTFAERSRILIDCIFGIDIDAEAIAVTRTGLLLHLLQDDPHPQPHSLPDLSQNLRCGNVLVDREPAAPPHSTFQTSHFDIVIGNPPYIDSEWMTHYLPDWRAYCTTRYKSAVGNWDLFCVFIEKALELCKPGGFHSFIVPNKLASADYAAPVRSLLTRDNQLINLRDYAHVPVFSAAVYPLVYLVRRGKADDAPPVRYELMQDLTRSQHVRLLDYLSHVTMPNRPWLLNASATQFNLIHQLQENFPRLRQVAQVWGAATVSEAYALQPLIQDSASLQPGDLMLINSGTVDRYRSLWGTKRLRYLGATYQHPIIPHTLAELLPKKRYQQATHPKLIVAGMTRRLECIADLNGSILAGKSTSIIVPNDGSVSLLYLLGLLNSQLIHFYFAQTFRGNCLNGGYLRIGPPQLQTIPISPISWTDSNDSTTETTDRPERLIDLVSQMLSAQQKQHSDPDNSDWLQLIQSLDAQIDQIVYELYGLSDRDIQDITNWSHLSPKQT
ncbi:MAG: Eco57I restriction-modification methylase domain-containing protein [Elainellaceae cyanobacterium]